MKINSQPLERSYFSTFKESVARIASSVVVSKLYTATITSSRIASFFEKMTTCYEIHYQNVKDAYIGNIGTFVTQVLNKPKAPLQIGTGACFQACASAWNPQYEKGQHQAWFCSPKLDPFIQAASQKFDQLFLQEHAAHGLDLASKNNHSPTGLSLTVNYAQACYDACKASIRSFDFEKSREYAINDPSFNYPNLMSAMVIASIADALLGTMDLEGSYPKEIARWAIGSLIVAPIAPTWFEGALIYTTARTVHSLAKYIFHRVTTIQNTPASQNHEDVKGKNANRPTQTIPLRTVGKYRDASKTNLADID
jgi:hypothetical protein